MDHTFTSRKVTQIESQMIPDEGSTFKPPLSVIVFHENGSTASFHEAAAAASSASILSTNSNAQHASTAGSTFAGYPSYLSSSSPSSPFRLQPRNPPKFMTSPSRSSSSSQRRKRSANSISLQETLMTTAATATANNAASFASSPSSLRRDKYSNCSQSALMMSTCCETDSIGTETTVRGSSVGTPLQHDAEYSSPRHAAYHAKVDSMTSTMMNFKGLSFLSPIAMDPLAKATYASMRKRADSSSSSDTNPASFIGSQSSRSCFSKYRGGSPQTLGGGGGGGIGSVGATVAETIGGMLDDFTIGMDLASPSAMLGSPRIAPLKIIGRTNSTACSSIATQSQMETATAMSPSIGTPRCSKIQRPPLHQNQTGSLLLSLDEDATSIYQANERKIPLTPPRAHLPSTVLCHPSTPGSTLSQDDPTSGLVAGATGRNSTEVPFIDLDIRARQRSLFDESPVNTVLNHGRTNSLDSLGKQSVLSMSPRSTPLPKLTLTPRSTTSSHLRQLFETALSSSSAADRTAMQPCRQALPSRTEMFSHQRPKNAFVSQAELSGATDKITPMWSPLFNDSTSLLAPPTLEDPIERFLRGASSAPKNKSMLLRPNPLNDAAVGDDIDRAQYTSECDSLSASDDDEAFFLATPSVIQGEKQSSSSQQHSFKQRRLSDASQRSSFSTQRSSFSSSKTAHQASNTSLRGINFLTSNASLDKIGDGTGALNSENGDMSDVVKRPGSSVSIGLTLEAGASLEEKGAGVDVDADDRCESSLSAAHQCSSTRDLVTPPIMAQPNSPPPLASSRIPPPASGFDHLFMAPTRSNIHYSTGYSPVSTGSPAMTSLSQQLNWPGAEEPWSPAKAVATRLLYARTNLDRSPLW